MTHVCIRSLCCTSILFSHDLTATSSILDIPRSSSLIHLITKNYSHGSCLTSVQLNIQFYCVRKPIVRRSAWVSMVDTRAIRAGSFMYYSLSHRLFHRKHDQRSASHSFAYFCDRLSTSIFVRRRVHIFPETNLSISSIV